MLRSGALIASVSCVLEFVVSSDRLAELAPLSSVADIAVVEVVCEDAESRFIQRQRSDEALRRPAILKALGVQTADELIVGVLRANQHRNARTDLSQSGLHHIQVDATAGYAPPIDEVVRFILDRPY